MIDIRLADTKLLYLRDVVFVAIGLTGGIREIKDLRIIFQCEKTNKSDPNTANIEIYNLNKDTRSLLEAKGTRISLDAGYIYTSATIFRGNITKVVHKSEPPDIITKIEARDGDNRYRNARFDKGYPPGVKLEQLINDLANELDLPVSSIIDLPATQYANGLTLTGQVRDHLDYLTTKNDLEWSIQDETLQIIPKKQTTLDEIIFLTSYSGLVGSPSKTKKGVEFKSLLQPRLRPGRRVRLESKFIEGIFKIRKVNHEGDSHEGEFVSICEAV